MIGTEAVKVEQLSKKEQNIFPQEPKYIVYPANGEMVMKILLLLECIVVIGDYTK